MRVFTFFWDIAPSLSWLILKTGFRGYRRTVVGIRIKDRGQPDILVALIVPAYCVLKQNKCTYNLSSFFQAVFVNLNEAGTSQSPGGRPQLSHYCCENAGKLVYSESVIQVSNSKKYTFIYSCIFIYSRIFIYLFRLIFGLKSGFFI